MLAPFKLLLCEPKAVATVVGDCNLLSGYPRRLPGVVADAMGEFVS